MASSSHSSGTWPRRNPIRSATATASRAAPNVHLSESSRPYGSGSNALTCGSVTSHRTRAAIPRPSAVSVQPSQAGKAGSRGRRSRRRPLAAYTRLSDVTTIVPIQAFQAPAQSAPVDSSTRNATLSTGTSPTVRTPVAGNARTSSRPGTTAQNGIAAQASQGTNWPASASADSSTASHIPHGPLDRPSGSAGAGTRAARTPGADMI